MQANHQSISDLVSIVVADIDTSEREATTNSLLVAKRFKKHHRDVLRAIRNLGCSEEFRLRNFAQSSFINEQGKTYPCYLMTQTERQASGFSPRFERSGRDGLLSFV